MLLLVRRCYYFYPSFLQLFGPQLSDSDERMARFIWSTWAKFAATSEGDAVVGWPQYTHQGGDYLELGFSSKRDNGLFDRANMLFWERLHHPSHPPRPLRPSKPKPPQSSL